jgi:hypothetical protein
MSALFRSGRKLVGRVLVAVALLPLTAWADDKSSIEGSWKLNVEKSHDIRKVVMSRMKYIDRSNMRILSTYSGPALVGIQVRRPDDKQITEMVNFIDSIIPVEPLVSIEQSGQSVKLTYKENRKREIYLTRPEALETMQSTAIDKDQVLTLAAWENDSLIIETNTTSGAKAIEKFELVVRNQVQTLKVSVGINAAKFRMPIFYDHYYMPVASVVVGPISSQ